MLKREKIRTEKRYHFINHKIWSFQPKDVMMATNMDNFRKGLNRFMMETIKSYRVEMGL